MCILIHRPKGAGKISPGWQADFWKKNPDGFGAWWIEGNRIVIRKTLKKEDVAAIIAEIEAQDHEAGLHWRMATHGAENLNNCHPYTVHTETGGERVLTCIGHNGVLSRWADGIRWDKAGKLIGESDTRQFINRCFEPLVHAFGLKPMFVNKGEPRDILESAVGSSNRLLLTNFRLGFSRLPDLSWFHWRGMYMSNTYAWSYAQREKEDGPSEPIPFVYPRRVTVEREEALPLSGFLGANVNCSANTASCGIREDTSSPTVQIVGPNGKTTVTSTPGKTNGAAHRMVGHSYFIGQDGKKKVLMPPDPDCGIHEWHWGDPPVTPEGQAELDARIAAVREKWYAGQAAKPFSEGTGASAVTRVSTERTAPTVDPLSRTAAPLLSVGEIVKKALGSERKAERASVRKVIEQVEREQLEEDEKELCTEDMTVQILASMDYSQVVEWCRTEPEEAAWLLQSVLAQKE